MINQRGINELIEDYKRALCRLNEAGYILEDAAILAVEVTGYVGPYSSNTIISTLNETYQVIYAALNQIRRATPTE